MPQNTDIVSQFFKVANAAVESTLESTLEVGDLVFDAITGVNPVHGARSTSRSIRGHGEFTDEEASLVESLSQWSRGGSALDDTFASRSTMLSTTDVSEAINDADDDTCVENSLDVSLLSGDHSVETHDDTRSIMSSTSTAGNRSGILDNNKDADYKCSLAPDTSEDIAGASKSKENSVWDDSLLDLEQGHEAASAAPMLAQIGFNNTSTSSQSGGDTTEEASSSTTSILKLTRDTNAGVRNAANSEKENISTSPTSLPKKQDFKTAIDKADIALSEIQCALNRAKARTIGIESTEEGGDVTIVTKVNVETKLSDEGEIEHQTENSTTVKVADDIFKSRQLNTGTFPPTTDFCTPNVSVWTEEGTPREDELKTLQSQCDDPRSALIGESNMAKTTHTSYASSNDVPTGIGSDEDSMCGHDLEVDNALDEINDILVLEGEVDDAIDEINGIFVQACEDDVDEINDIFVEEREAINGIGELTAANETITKPSKADPVTATAASNPVDPKGETTKNSSISSLRVPSKRLKEKAMALKVSRKGSRYNVCEVVSVVTFAEHLSFSDQVKRQNHQRRQQRAAVTGVTGQDG